MTNEENNKAHWYYYLLTIRQKEELEKLNALPDNVLTYEKIPEE